MSWDVKALSGLLVVAGIGHFVKPEPFEAIVPKPLPYKRELVYASGVVEVASGVMLLHPRTRATGGRIAAALLASVFPANVQMTISSLRSSRSPWWFKLGTIARLPLQAPLIRTALKASRS